MAASSSIELFRLSDGAGILTGLHTTESNSARLPVVLLHGIGSGAESWRSLLGLIAPTRRAIAWNAPGYGGSTALAAREPDADDYAQALDRLMDRADVARCHLVGHSLGAIVAARMAILRPDRLETLTLASIALGHARLAAERRAELKTNRLADLDALGPRGLAEKRGPRLLGPDASPQARRAVIDVMAAIDPAGYTAASNMLAAADTLADLSRLKSDLPVKIIYGDADVITPPAANRAAVEALPWADVTTIENGGHAVYVEKAPLFFAALDDFLRGRP